MKKFTRWGCLKRLKKDEVERIYWKEGMTIKEIAKQFGCSSTAVQRWMKKWGIPRRSRRRLLKPKCRVLQDAAKLGYLAGIIDGEGSIFLTKQNVPTIEVGNTDFRLIQWLTKEIGGDFKVKSETRPNHKTAYVWYIRLTMDILNILKSTMPYLIIKKENAQKLLNFCEQRLQKQMRPIQ